MAQELVSLDLRLDPDLKDLAVRASVLVGSESVNNFVVQAIREKACRVLEEADVVRLNAASFKAFQATCQSEAPENRALQGALRRRNERKKDRIRN